MVALTDDYFPILEKGGINNPTILCQNCGGSELYIGIGRLRFGWWEWCDENKLPSLAREANIRLLGLTKESNDKAKAIEEVNKYLAEADIARRALLQNKEIK